MNKRISKHIGEKLIGKTLAWIDYRNGNADDKVCNDRYEILSVTDSNGCTVLFNTKLNNTKDYKLCLSHYAIREILRVGIITAQLGNIHRRIFVL